MDSVFIFFENHDRTHVNLSNEGGAGAGAIIRSSAHFDLLINLEQEA